MNAKTPETTIRLHEGDLPDGLDLCREVAIDSETMGLRLGRDPLCVVQLSGGDGVSHVVRLNRPGYDAPNLKRLLTDPNTLKIFHFGRFDIAMFFLHLGIVTAPVYCTKIASKLARTYTDRHGLKDVVRELLSKGQKKILLNLGDVNYIDSSGIGELVSAFTTVRNQGGELKLLNLTKKVHDLLQITKLYTVFDVKDDEAAAVKSFS